MPQRVPKGDPPPQVSDATPEAIAGKPVPSATQSDGLGVIAWGTGCARVMRRGLANLPSVEQRG